ADQREEAAVEGRRDPDHSESTRAEGDAPLRPEPDRDAIDPQRSTPVNFIVIVSDTFRYDYLGANGNAWIKTPELDAFSRIAVNFVRCTISSFPTIPTRTDWFTGRYSFPFHGWQPLDPKATVLAGVLS